MRFFLFLLFFYCALGYVLVTGQGGGVWAAEEANLDVTSQILTYDPQTHQMTAEGDVVVHYKTYLLKAKRAVYDRLKKQVTVSGQVSLLKPDEYTLHADAAQFTQNFKKGFARYVTMLLNNQASIRARYVVRQQGNLTIFEDARYTRCKTCVFSGGAPLWEITSEEATLNEEEKRVYHRNVSFLFAGIPIAWLPYFSHPTPKVQNATGFLVPSFRYSNLYGAAAEIPFFWAIDPDYDLLLNPMAMSKNGVILSGEWRQKFGDIAYHVKGSGLYQLNKDALPNPGNEIWRWYIQTWGGMDLNSRWKIGFDTTFMSDETFMRRYDLDKRTEVENTVYLQGISGRSSFLLKASQYQGLLETDRDKDFPFLAPYFSHSTVLGTSILGGALHLDDSFYGIWRRAPVSPYPSVFQGEGQIRANAILKWTREWISQEGVQVTPFVQGRGDLYWTKNLPQNLSNSEVTTLFLPSSGVDLRWPFLKVTDSSQQMLTPVAQLVVAPKKPLPNTFGNEDAISLNFDTTSVFLENRTTGLDLRETGTRANLGMLYTLSNSSRQILKASFGQSFGIGNDLSFMENSGLSGQFSDLVGGISLAPFPHLLLQTQARLHPQTFALRTLDSGLSVNYGGLIASVNYARLLAEPTFGRLNDEQQIWFSAEYALYDGWSLFGGLRYDLETGRLIKGSSGIAYNCDCAQIRLSYQEDATEDRDIQNNRSVVLSVELKTLGSTKVSPGF